MPTGRRQRKRDNYNVVYLVWHPSNPCVGGGGRGIEERTAGERSRLAPGRNYQSFYRFGNGTRRHDDCDGRTRARPSPRPIDYGESKSVPIVLPPPNSCRTPAGPTRVRNYTTRADRRPRLPRSTYRINNNYNIIAGRPPPCPGLVSFSRRTIFRRGARRTLSDRLPPGERVRSDDKNGILNGGFFCRFFFYFFCFFCFWSLSLSLPPPPLIIITPDVVPCRFLLRRSPRRAGRTGPRACAPAGSVRAGRRRDVTVAPWRRPTPPTRGGPSCRAHNATRTRRSHTDGKITA